MAKLNLHLNRDGSTQHQQEPQYGQPNYGTPDQQNYNLQGQPQYGQPQYNSQVPQQPVQPHYNQPQYDQPNQGFVPPNTQPVQPQPYYPGVIQSNPTPPSTPKKSKKGLIIGLTCGGVALIAGIILLCIFVFFKKQADLDNGYESADVLIEKSLTAISNKDMDAFMKCYIDENYASQSSYLAMKTTLQSIFDQNLNIDTSSIKYLTETELTSYDDGLKSLAPDKVFEKTIKVTMTQYGVKFTQNLKYIIAKFNDKYCLYDLATVPNTIEYIIDNTETSTETPTETPVETSSFPTDEDVSNAKIIYEAVNKTLADEDLFDDVFITNKIDKFTMVLTNKNGEVFGESKQEIYHAALKDAVNKVLNDQVPFVSNTEINGMIPDGWGVALDDPMTSNKTVHICAVQHMGDGQFRYIEVYPEQKTYYETISWDSKEDSVKTINVDEMSCEVSDQWKQLDNNTYYKNNDYTYILMIDKKEAAGVDINNLTNEFEKQYNAANNSNFKIDVNTNSKYPTITMSGEGTFGTSTSAYINMYMVIVNNTIYYIGLFDLNNNNSHIDEYNQIVSSIQIKEKTTTTESTESTEVNTEEPTEQPVTGDLSNDLWSHQVQIEGTVYTMDIPYSKVKDIFTVDMAKYGYSDGYLLNSGDKTYGTIDVDNSKYDDKIYFTVGFKNNTSKAIDILDSDIWTFKCDIAWAKSNNYPSIVLPKGITWGSSAADIEAAYGKPSEEIYRSDELKYSVYEYVDDKSDYHVKFYAYDDGGVKCIEISKYR